MSIFSRVVRVAYVFAAIALLVPMMVSTTAQAADGDYIKIDKSVSTPPAFPPTDIPVSNSDNANVTSPAFSYQFGLNCVTTGAICQDIVVTDVLPDNIEIVPPIPAAWTWDAGSNTISIPVDPFNGSQTLSIPVRFVRQPGAVPDTTYPRTNTATMDATIDGVAETSTSNSVDVVGRVRPIGGAKAELSFSPSSVLEFSDATVTMRMDGRNSGTTTADTVVTTSENRPNFYNRFDLVSIAPDAGVTYEVKVGGAWVAYTGQTHVEGIRVTGSNIASNATAGADIVFRLRDYVYDTTPPEETVISGDSQQFQNLAVTSTTYSEPGIDATSSPATAVMKVEGERTKVTAKKASTPSSADAGSSQEVVTELAASMHGAGGVDTIVFTDPPAGQPSNYSSTLKIKEIAVRWPVPTPAASTVSVSANCPAGTSTGSLTAAADITTPTTETVTLTGACGDLSTVTDFSVTFDAPYVAATDSGATFASNAEPSVIVTSDLNPSQTAGSYPNHVDVTATTPHQFTASGQSNNTFVVNKVTYEIDINKQFAYPITMSRFNTAQLAATYKGNKPADEVIVTDVGSELETDHSAGGAFFDEYDIVAIRRPGCGNNRAVSVEYYDRTDNTWKQVAGAGANACDGSVSTPIYLSAAETANAEGVRFVYTRPGGIPSNTTVNPVFDILRRETDRDTGDPVGLPVMPSPNVTSPPNCATSVASRGPDTVASDDLAPDCPVITQITLPVGTGDGLGVSKRVMGHNGHTLPASNTTAIEGSRETFDVAYNVVLFTYPTTSVTLQDPPDAGQGKAGFSRIFNNVADIERVWYDVPPHEQATIDYLIGGTWVQQAQVDAGSSANPVMIESGANANAEAFRLTLEESPTSPGGIPGIEHASFARGMPVKATYRLRDTFRSDVGEFHAGDAVRNNLCYDPSPGANPAPATEDAAGNVVDPTRTCDLSDPISGVTGTHWGVIFNDVQATAIRGDGSSVVNTDGGYGDNHFKILNGAIAVQAAKTIAPETVPLPVPGTQPGTKQEVTLTLVGENTSDDVNIDELTIDDSDAEFWNAFEFVSASVSEGSPEVVFTHAGGTETGTLADLNSFADKSSITSIKVTFAHVPADDTRTVTIVARLRNTSLAIDSYDNKLIVTGQDIISDAAYDDATDTVHVRERRARVETAKSIELAPGQVNAVDTAPLLNIHVVSKNTGELDLTSLITEDDDAYNPGDYPGGTVPATPANLSEDDFWGQVNFSAITALTPPTGADTGTLQYFDGTTWVDAIADAPVADLTPVAATTALVGADVQGLRVTWNSTTEPHIVQDESSVLDFQVNVDVLADITKSFVNCAESGYRSGTLSEYQHPACDDFLPKEGSPKVDVKKLFKATNTSATSGAAGSEQRYVLSIANTGATALGLRSTAPFTVVDTLETNLDYDATSANVSFDLTNAPNSVLTQTPTPTYDAATKELTWVWDTPANQYLAPGDTLVIEITLFVTPAIPPNSSAHNWVGVVVPSNAYCTAPDVYQNGRCETEAVLNVIEQGAVRATKRSLGNLPNTVAYEGAPVACPPDEPVSYPCIAEVSSGGEYTWYLDFMNVGNTSVGSPILIDRLPVVGGDSATVLPSPRGTEWLGSRNAATSGITMTSPATLPNGVETVYEYITDAADVDGCISELTSTTPKCGDWSVFDPASGVPADAAAIRVHFTGAGITLNPNETVSIQWNELAPRFVPLDSDKLNAQAQDTPDDRVQQWNSFGYEIEAGSSILFNESKPKAGVQFDTAALKISKLVDETTVIPDDQLELFGAFDITYSCEMPFISGADNDLITGTVSLKSGETKALTGLPSGTICTLAEPDPRLADTFEWAQDDLDPDTDGFQVKIDEAYTVVHADLTNKFDGKGLVVRKHVRGDAGGDTDYAYSVECTFPILGGAFELPLNTDDDAFTLTKDGQRIITGLPAGATCTVTETDALNADETTYSTDGGTTSTAGTEVDVSITGATQSVDFTNSYYATLKLTKVVENTTLAPTSQYEPFGFTVTCAGAAPATQPSLTTSNPTWTWDGDRLLNGTECTITEAAQPAGVTTTATIDGVTTTLTDLSTTFTVNDETDDDAIEVAYTNKIEAASLEIAKVVEGDAGDDTSYDITLACVANGKVVALDAADASFALAAGESRVIESLPPQSECTVTETNPGRSDVQTVTIDDGTPVAGTVATVVVPTVSKVTITNRYEATFSLTKVLDNPSIAANSMMEPFEFTVSCDNGDGVALAPKNQPALAAGETWTWDGDSLLNGATCTIAEAEQASAVSTVATLNGADVALTDREMTFTLSDEDTADDVDTPDAVEYTNTVSTASLSISKAIIGAPGTDVDYGIEVSCVFDGQPLPLAEGDASFRIAADETHTIEHLPTDTECTVTESDPGRSDVQTLVVDGGDPVQDVAVDVVIGTNETVEFTNHYYDVTFGVTKEFENSSIVPDSAYAPFGFDVSCDNGDGVALSPMTQPSLAAGETWWWDGDQLLNGATCTVTEAAQRAEVTTTAAIDGKEVVLDGLTAVFELDDEDTPEDTDTPDVIVFTNTVEHGSVTVSKIVEGTPTGVSQFNFTAACTDQTGKAVVLPSEDASFTLADGASKEISGLPMGTTCEITETTPGSSDYQKVAVDEDPAVAGTSATITIDDEMTMVKVTNGWNPKPPARRLPRTGSDVTMTMTYLGLFALGAGIFLVLIGRRRRSHTS